MQGVLNEARALPLTRGVDLRWKMALMAVPSTHLPRQTSQSSFTRMIGYDAGNEGGAVPTLPGLGGKGPSAARTPGFQAPPAPLQRR